MQVLPPHAAQQAMPMIQAMQQWRQLVRQMHIRQHNSRCCSMQHQCTPPASSPHLPLHASKHVTHAAALCMPEHTTMHTACHNWQHTAASFLMHHDHCCTMLFGKRHQLLCHACQKTPRLPSNKASHLVHHDHCNTMLLSK
jgi:hypothetical protein